MRHLLFPILLLALSLTACKPIAYLVYGIKQPKIEHRASLSQYLDKKEIPADNIATLSFEHYESVLNSIGNNIPEVRVFDRAGRLLPYGEGQSCTAPAFDFIEELHRDSSYAHSEETSLEEAAARLLDMDGNPLELHVEEDADFVALIYWARFTGRLNKEHVGEWERQARGNANARVQVVKVNLDIQEHWGEENLRVVMGKDK